MYSRHGETVREENGREIRRECYIAQCIIKKDRQDREIEKPTESRCLERKNGVWWKRRAAQIDSVYEPTVCVWKDKKGRGGNMGT